MSWFAAIGGSTITSGILLAVALSYTHGDFFREIQSASDAPPPEWLQRISPPNKTADAVVRSRPFAVYIGLMTAAFMCLILGSFSGTVGWSSTALLGYAMTGRWPGSGGNPEDSERLWSSMQGGG
jgi:hypothetical protein